MQAPRLAIEKTIGVAFAAGFTAASVAGTTASSWYLGETLAPQEESQLGSFPSPAACLTALAIAVEGLRLLLSLLADRIWRGARFGAAVFATPLWLACATYCVLVPLIAFTVTPLAEVWHAEALTIAAIAWIFIQIAATALPGVAWPEPALQAPVCAAPALAAPRPIQLAAPPAAAATASRADLFRMLGELTKLPQGSHLPQGGRIGPNQEIVIAHGGLARLVGRPKPTVRRWLEELERDLRIEWITTKRQVRIRVRRDPQGEHANGHAGTSPAAALLKAKETAAAARPPQPP